MKKLTLPAMLIAGILVPHRYSGKFNFVFTIALFLAGILSFDNAVYAQTPLARNYNYQRIVTKTPEADGIRRFGEIPVNTSTGVPDISVPIDNIKIGKDLYLPISLSYHASGFRIEDVSSSVGLKWSLFAGGSVDRDVNGMPDEDYYFSHYSSLDAVFEPMRDEYTDAGNLARRDMVRNTVDLNQDSYSYSFLNHSDAFYYSKGVYRSEYNHQKYKIERPSQNQYIITDDKGNKYYFGTDPDNSNVAYGYSASYFSAVPGWSDPDNIPSVYGTTGWKLLKVKTPYGNQLGIEYNASSNNGYTVRSSDVATIQVSDGLPYGPCGCSGTHLSVNYTAKDFTTALVTKITGEDKIAEFNYITSPAFSAAKLLQSIYIKAKDGSTLKYVLFTYATITSGGTRSEMQLTEVKIYGSDNVLNQHYKFDYIVGALPEFGTLSKDIFGYYNGAANSYLVPSNEPSVIYKAVSRTPEIIAAKSFMMNKITYPTGGTTEFEYELNKEGNRYAGGIRVKIKKDYEPLHNKTYETEYQYSGLYEGLVFPYNAANIMSIKSNCVQLNYNSEILNPDIAIRNHGYRKVITRKREFAGGTDIIHEDYYSYDNLRNDFTLYPVKYLEREYVNNNNIFTPVSSVKYDFSFSIDTNYTEKVYKAEGIGSQEIFYPEPWCKKIYLPVNPIIYTKSKTFLITKQTDTLFSGASTTIKQQDYFYEDPLNLSPTRVTYSQSDGYKLISKVKYPTFFQGLTGTDAATLGVKLLQDKFMISQPVETSAYKETSGSPQHMGSVYYQFHTDKPVVKEVYQFPTDLTYSEALLSAGAVSRNSNYIKKAEMLTYDAKANLLEGKATSGVSSAYIYNQYDLAMAEAENTGVGHIAFSSFEDNAKGNWTYAGTPVVVANAPAGAKVYNLSLGTISKSGLTSSKSYLVSYWSNSGSYTVTGSGTPVAVYTVNGWTYYRHVITGQTTCSISGSGYLDEIRIHPIEAKMRTLTYKVPVGLIAETDVSGRMTTFEYDNFQQLLNVKDYNGDVVKNYKYNYSLASKGIPLLYYNTAISQSIQKNNCGAGQTGSFVTFVVPAGKYSATSQAAADALATAEVSASGQAYANAQGTCVSSGPYARIEYANNSYADNIDIDGTVYGKADMYIRLYSDAACTISYVAPAAIQINLRENNMINSNTGPGSSSTDYVYTVPASSSQVYFGNNYLYHYYYGPYSFLENNYSRELLAPSPGYTYIIAY